MALSDACFEFTQRIISATQELLTAVEWYADSPLDYGEEIVSLRNACLAVRQTPWNPEAAITLILLVDKI